MKTKRLVGILALSLGLTLALLAGLQTAQAAPPRDLFAEPDGTGATCSRVQPCTLQTALVQAAN